MSKFYNTTTVSVPENDPIWEWDDTANSWAIYTSNGNPNGQTTANVGSLDVDRNNGDLWRKAFGTDAFGWVLGDETPVPADITYTSHGFDLTTAEGDRVPVMLNWNGAAWAEPTTAEEITHGAVAAPNANTLTVRTIAEISNMRYWNASNVVGAALGEVVYWNSATNAPTLSKTDIRLYQVSQTSLTVIDLWVDQMGDIATTLANRRIDADDLGTGGSFTLDFEGGDFDHKTRVLNADATITVQDPNQTSSFDLWLSSSVLDANREITWVITGLAAGENLPSFVDSDVPIKTVFHFDNDSGTYRIDRDPRQVKTVDLDSLPVRYGTNVLDGSITLDAEVALNFVLTGTLAANVSFEVPDNLPLDTPMTIEFSAAQTNVPQWQTGAGQYVLYFAPLTHAGKATFDVKRLTSGYQLTGVDVRP